ncbi:calcium-binding protein [Hydrogenophaga sp.]|uniref:calcium-binding protein n=2 Tax=Hydrogenophaga sp. TaxID=1904254 RepID=UPI0025C720A6|nr:calcium-binding protein [Hydrogenophaga sp.]
MFGAVGAKYINPHTTRPLFDWMGSYLPDGLWRSLESATFGAGAARLDPSGAVYTSMLLHRIDNSIQLNDLGRLFDLASSAREGRETIALLNDLGHIFQPARPPLSDDATDEQLIAYAGRVAAVTDAFSGGLRIKTAVPTASDARLDFGAFLCLQNLSPLVVCASDPEAQASLNALWQNTHGDVYLDWASDRQAVLRGDEQHEMAFSDQWVADRLAMLNALLDTHVRDLSATDTLTPNPVSGLLAAQYLDLTSDARIQVGLDLMSTPRVVFGTAGDDAAGELSGNGGKDHLYGGAGNDRLTGLGGADHLEGGSGDDVLDGGAGNDRLLGGSGSDTYLLDGSAGSDVLIDEDGGVIRYQGQILSGGKESAPGSGEWQDGAVRYHLMADGDRQHLLISAGAGTVLVQNWHNGHLGIQLQDAPADIPAPSANLVLHGDRAPLDHDPEAEGVQSSTDALGNLIVKPDQIEADRVDTLYDDTGNDQLFGHGGDDTLNAWRGGDDLLDGGTGNDHLRAGAGVDVLIGGDGLDRLFGHEGNDRLYAQFEQNDDQVIAAHDPDTEDAQGIAEQGELLVGGNGDDWQVGHQRADLLLGGPGRDQLWGGAGDDVIYGDLDASTAQPNWGLQRSVLSDPSFDIDTHRVTTQGISYSNVDTSATGEGDVLHGGAGDDWLFGEGGQDRLDGGSGADVLFGGTDSDWLEGGSGNDRLMGDNGAGSSDGHGNDHLNGGAGDDRLWGDAGHDQLFGGEGDDRLSGDNTSSAAHLHGNDFLDGGTGNDTLWGNGGADQLLGGSGADVLWGDDDARDAIDTAYHGQDLLMGEDGDDALVGGGGADKLLGGEGHDVLYGDDLSDDLSTYTVEASAHGDDWLDGGAGNDVLYGGGGRDHLLGGDGDDDLFGGDGDDTLDGGKGWNRLEGGSGDDLYLVRGADLLNPASADAQFFDVSTTISDKLGRNTIRVDALQRDITLLPMDNSDGSTGLCLVWPMGTDAQGRSQQAALGLGSLTDVSHFTIEFADGQRVALARWMGDALQGSMTAATQTPGEWLVGTAGQDRLGLYASGTEVMGGRGDDTIELNADAEVVHFDRGDGHDVLRGWTSGHRIAFGAGIAPEDLRLTVTPEGKVLISIAPPDGNGSADRIELPFSPWSLLSSTFLADIAFADGQALSWRDLLERGVRIEAPMGTSRIDGTPAKDHFSAMPQDATLSGGQGDDQYHFGAGERATVQDAEGRNRIVFSADAASDWDAVQVQRAAPGADGQVSNDLLLNAGGASIRLLNALALGERFDIALADGRTRSLADLVRTLPAMGVDGSAGSDHLISGDGHDLLMGQDGNDTLDGQGGGDALLGGLGDDVYRIDLTAPQAGHDQVADPQGRNVVRFAPGVHTDALRAERIGDSSDLRLWLDGQTEASLTVRRALEGAVVRYEFDDGSGGVSVWTLDTLIERLGLSAGLSLVGSSSQDDLSGTVLGDFISGGAGDDTLSGKAGNDELLGGDGADHLEGGRGGDTLRGGEGADRYTFQIGDGVDQLIDAEGASLVRFGPGITPDRLSATRETIDGAGYVRLRYSANDAVLIRDDAPLDTLSFAFANGEVRSALPLYAEILVGSGVSVAGSAGDDALYGTASADTLQGLDGIDNLQGGAGNDRLDGGAGSDFLHGGAGLDSYTLRADAGLDRLYEVPGQVSRLVLDGIAPEALMYGRVGNDLLVQHSGSNAASFVQGAYTAGTRWTLVDAQGREHDLLALASRAIATQTPQQSQAAFAQAADAQAGPVPMGVTWWGHYADRSFMRLGDQPGSFTVGTGTTEERVYQLNKVTQHTQNDDAQVVLRGERDSQSVGRERFASVERTETYLGQRFSHYEYTTIGSIPDRIVPLLEYMGNGSMVLLPAGARIVSGDRSGGPSDRPIYVYIPGDIRTFSTEVYEPEWRTSTYFEDYYRTTYDNVRLTEVYQGGDGANHVSLDGSAAKIVSTGGGDDRVASSFQPYSNWDTRMAPPTCIDGGAGNDRIVAGEGDDELHGGMGSDHLDAGAGADIYVIDAVDDGWDVIDERTASTVSVSIHLQLFANPDRPKEEWWYRDADPALIAEVRALAGTLDAQQEQDLRDRDWIDLTLPATADTLNALMRLEEFPLKPRQYLEWARDSTAVNPHTAVLSADLDQLLARVSAQPLVSYSDFHTDRHGPRPRIRFTDDVLSALSADTVRLSPGIDPAALQAHWSTLDTDEGPRRALSLSWGGPGGVHVLMPEDGAPPGVGIERFEFADGTVWTMEQMVSLVPLLQLRQQVLPMPEPVAIETGPAITAYVGPNPLAASAAPGLPDLIPWDDEPSPDWPAPVDTQERRWLQDLMYRQYERAYARSWDLDTPPSPEPVALQSDVSAALAPSTANAAFEAQFNSLIQAMSAFAPQPMASFSPSSESLTSAYAPVLAAPPF